LLVGNNKEEINKILKELAKKFKIKISKNTKSYIGHKIEINEDHLILIQRDYIKRILLQSKTENAKTIKVPQLQEDKSKTPLKTKLFI
jgi:hypothetical protein